MKECALIMMGQVGSVALVHHNFLVNAVKLIGVVLMDAKMVERVLFQLLTMFLLQNANVPEIMLG